MLLFNGKYLFVARYGVDIQKELELNAPGLFGRSIFNYGLIELDDLLSRCQYGDSFTVYHSCQTLTLSALPGFGYTVARMIWVVSSYCPSSATRDLAEWLSFVERNMI